ncbi:HTH-type transcriptional regulator CynR [Arsenophonus endosymbiont of Aleurodicus dispersus]|uniref:LysR family transcriptional regulator n=1 Tax=Arsenophonus endosymbiont of Aleurodicus dispersus TaxID=235559 RepID=UPI000EB2376A|nr:LysR family transcriptional regulator [Arsenophonus endosymbiont of Aleurodicus dispersus]VAY02431.1 HTH-type transcriptional regulator CynR [Arsenophonus endosymbiont of Aleurodicus dispersus]
MINSNRPIMNLNIDLLRTFVAVANLNTFAAAAVAVCRTQSAVSQQMQRLEQLIGRELFKRHGRNKLLTDHGLQLLGYARKILRANDDASASLNYNDTKGELRVGVSDDTTNTLLQFMLNRIASVYPRMTVAIYIKRARIIKIMLDNDQIDLALISTELSQYPREFLRNALIFWQCTPYFKHQFNEPVPLVVVTDETNPFRKIAINTLNAAGIKWRITYEAASLSAVLAAVNAEVGITAHPLEMQTSNFKILSESDGLPRLPEISYWLYRNISQENKDILILFSAIKNNKTPYHSIDN